MMGTPPAPTVLYVLPLFFWDFDKAEDCKTDSDYPKSTGNVSDCPAIFFCVIKVDLTLSVSVSQLLAFTSDSGGVAEALAAEWLSPAAGKQSQQGGSQNAESLQALERRVS